MNTLIKGWSYTGQSVLDSLKDIEIKVGRVLIEEDKENIAQLWDWNYSDNDCIEMLSNGMDAIGYDMEAYEAGDVEDFHC